MEERQVTDYHRPAEDQLDTIFNIAYELVPQESYQLPSGWAESKRVLGSEYTSKPGPFSFDNTPFMREIVDNFSPESSVREFYLQKGVQVAGTTAVLENAIGYGIDVYPTPMLYSSATQGLTNLNMETRVDAMIHTCGLQGKIRPSVLKKSNKNTGDTKTKKEFAGGVLYGFGAASAANARQFSAAWLLADEVDSWALDVEKQGCPFELLKARTSAFSNTRKIFALSTPLHEGTSKIAALFARGDRRYFNVPCPHCGEFQVLKWGAEDPDGAGVKFEKDPRGSVIRESVHYQCVSGCKISMFKKYEMMNKGKWIPTAEPLEPGIRSYHLSTFYSNFFDWYQCCCQWAAAGQDKQKLQVFVNNILGETWKEDVRVIKDEELRKNSRPYQPCTVPNIISQKDGNGKIVILTASVDVNGLYDNPDGWLAFEVKGHCRNGQTYSIGKAGIHGVTDSGGTAWIALKELLDRPYMSDDGMEYHIQVTGIDNSPKTKAVYSFCSQSPRYITIKGLSKPSANDRFVYKAKNAQGELWSVDTIYYKNNIAEHACLQWAGNPLDQPYNFMNFPNNLHKGGFEDVEFERKYGVTIAGNGYDKAYFKNYSAESPIIQRQNPDDEFGTVVGWKKRNTRAQNHFFDTCVYNYAMLDIFCKIMSDHYPELKNMGSKLMMTHFADSVERTGNTFFN